MATQAQRRKGFVVSIVGLILVVLGVLWLAVIFPVLDKMPTDYERTLYFNGNFSVLSPATQSMVSFPIEQTLAQEAVGTSKGALLIHEIRTVKNAATGEDISSVYGDESTLAVNRHTLKFVPDIDERHREGYWGPPRGLDKGDTFDLYHDGADKPLTARYVKDDKFRGMKVVIFQIQEGNISIGNDTTSGMPLPLLLDVSLTLTIDPKSGTVVDQDSTTTTSIDMSSIGRPVVTVQISNVRYAERTIVDLIDVAKDAGKMLMWFEDVIPWVLIGLGAFMVVIDTIFIGRRKTA